MPISEIYCIGLLAVLGIATAVTVAATLFSIYRKDPTPEIIVINDGHRQRFSVSPREVDRVQTMLHPHATPFESNGAAPPVSATGSAADPDHAS